MKKQKNNCGINDVIIREAIIELLRNKSTTTRTIIDKLWDKFNLSEESRVCDKKSFSKDVEDIVRELKKEGFVECRKKQNYNYYKVELLNKEVDTKGTKSIAIRNGCSMYFLKVGQRDTLRSFNTSNGASVYFLFPAGDHKKPYIGYTGNISERINKHCSDKKWVKRILFFMYNQDSIHFDICDAAYLEYKLIEELRHTNRKKADEPYVKPESKIMLDRVFEDIKHLIEENGLGYLFFKPRNRVRKITL